MDVGKISQVEFHAGMQAKFKEWKYNRVLIIDGSIIYRKGDLSLSNIYFRCSCLSGYNL